jgi:NAD(P)-dependent dehydrogenase (short-subunit alcohol dehydrogenase family)
VKDFRGRTAFVTGGASGIGLGMARAFGRQGMNVVVADIDQNAAKAAAERLVSEQIRAVPVLCDVTERGSVREAALETIAQFGRVHVVCNNAGVAVAGPIGTVKERDWDWIIDVNLKGVVYGVETFVPLIKSHGEGGHFVNTASMAGLLAFPLAEPYTATKFAVVAMSEGWAGQLRPFDIGVSVLCPGFVRTQIYDSGRAKQDRYGGKAVLMSEQGAQAVMAGIDPDIVGNRVVEAVRDNDFYCFTHPNFKDVMELRFAEIRAGFEKAERSEALKAVKNWPTVGATPSRD